MKRRTKTYGLAVGVAAIVCLALIYVLGMREEDTSQVYQTDRNYSISTPFSHSTFEFHLSTLQQFGGGEVIFSGGKGFVRFQVREDGKILVLVPVSASIPCIQPETLARFFISDKYKFHNIRLARHERQRLEDMEPLQNAVERKISYSGTAPHVFLEAALGLEVTRASVLAESILTEVFQIGAGRLEIHAGEYREFRWEWP